MPTFSPPTVNDVPRVLPDTRGPAYLLMRHYSPLPRGRSVLLRNGRYVTVDNPDNAELMTLTEGTSYFLGGHLYDVTDTVATLLASDGYDIQQSGGGGYVDSYSDSYGDVF